MTPYERYCFIMLEKGLEPTMDEAELHKAWGIKIEDKEEHIPFVARNSSTARNVHATLNNHISNTDKKVKKNDQSVLLGVLENRLKDKKKSPKPKAVKPPKIKVVKPPKIPKPPKEPKPPKVNLKAMSPEERRIHTNTLYRLRMEKKRKEQGKAGRFLMSSLSAQEQEEHKKLQRKQYRETSKAKHGVKVMTPEEMQHKRDIANAWYAKNKEQRRIKRNEYIATNPEARIKRNEAVRKWEEKNREHRREYSRLWVLEKRKRLREETLCA